MTQRAYDSISKDQRRQVILKAASSLFEKANGALPSVAQIARAADLGKGSLSETGVGLRAGSASPQTSLKSCKRPCWNIGGVRWQQMDLKSFERCDVRFEVNALATTQGGER